MHRNLQGQNRSEMYPEIGSYPEYGLLSFNPFWEQETQALKVSQKKTQPRVEWHD